MNKYCVLIAFAGLILLSSVSRADVVISNPGGNFSVGIGPNGELYDYNSNTGFRRNSDGYDPLAPGTPRDSWGIAGNGGSAWADQSFFGTVGVVSTISAYTSSATYATTTSNNFQVAQNYSFAAPNLLKIATSITNTGSTATTVLFQRDIDWDIAVNFGGTFNDDNTIANAITGANAPVVDSSSNGFEFPDPSSPYAFSCAAAGCNVFNDIGAGIKLDLGLLGAGKSTTFNFFYGISDVGMSAAALEAEARALGVSYDVLSQDIGEDAAALLGFGTPVPEPSSIALAITAFAGICGLAYYRRRRAIQN